MAAAKKGFTTKVTDTVNSFFASDEEDVIQTTDNRQQTADTPMGATLERPIGTVYPTMMGEEVSGSESAMSVAVGGQASTDINRHIDIDRQTYNIQQTMDISISPNPKRPIGAVRPAMMGERKSKRYNLLLKPSVFIGLTKLVQIEGGSVNNLINDILEDYLIKRNMK